ncbi:MAG: hypothetical protein L3K26_04105 [Candidatus Hydrogenedentes bacterium]|nr:hypothetical protein [Candidatus Hydrogenedentota bacterium]
MTDTQRRAIEIENALRRAVAAELDKKNRLGQYAVVSKDGKTVRIEPLEASAAKENE